MIEKYITRKYCSEPIELIENYDKAIADTTKTWHCHHRWETDYSYSQQELKDMGEYYGVTADKLIFLTPSEHISLHGKNMREETKNKIRERMNGNTYTKGMKLSEEHKKKIGESSKKMWENESYRKKMCKIMKGGNKGSFKKGNKVSEETQRKITEKLTNGKCSKAVLQYTKTGEFVREFPSIQEVERQLGISNSKVCSVCKGKRNSVGGYVWRYK